MIFYLHHHFFSLRHRLMIFDGQTGRILANKYGVSDISQGNKTAGLRLQVQCGGAVWWHDNLVVDRDCGHQ